MLSEDLTPRKRNNIIKGATKSEINAIAEIVLNFLRGNLPTTEVSSLKRYRKAYREISGKNANWINRKRLIIKYGKAIRVLFKRLETFFRDEFRTDEIQ